MKVPSPVHRNSVAILPASREDIPSMIAVHMAAFASDNMVRLKLTGDQYRQKLQAMLDAQISNPECMYTKAVDKQEENGTVLGWQGSRLIGFDESEGEKAKANVGEAEVQRADAGKRNENEESNDPSSQTSPTLKTITDEDLARRRAEWMCDKKYIYIHTVVTHPSYQRRGIGTALVRQVTEKADRLTVPCWLESSPIAHSVYLKAGFKDVGHSEVDLQKFAPGGKDIQSGWGVYRLWSMLRLPVTIPP